jgi:hypothetical protein
MSDLDLLEDADLTEIGERWAIPFFTCNLAEAINSGKILSGGQKARGKFGSSGIAYDDSSLSRSSCILPRIGHHPR